MSIRLEIINTQMFPKPTKPEITKFYAVYSFHDRFGNDNQRVVVSFGKLIESTYLQQLQCCFCW